MSCRYDYSIEEWDDILKLAAIGIIQKLCNVEVSFMMKGVFSVIKEAIAYQNFFAKAIEKYPENELIIDVIDSLKTQKSGKNKELKPENVPNIKKLADRVNALLEERSDEKEAGEYRAFVYELTYEIFNSAGGGFFGFSSNIDADEARFLRDLKAALLE
jgi:hypothetical protein